MSYDLILFLVSSRRKTDGNIMTYIYYYDFHLKK